MFDRIPTVVCQVFSMIFWTSQSLKPSVSAAKPSDGNKASAYPDDIKIVCDLQNHRLCISRINTVQQAARSVIQVMGGGNPTSLLFDAYELEPPKTTCWGVKV